MSIELELAGKAVHFVSINIDNGISSQEEILKHCTFPQLQDTEELGIWNSFNGYKDDFYILDSEGIVRRYIAFIDGKSTLEESDDYAFIKGSILEVLEEEKSGSFTDPQSAEEALGDDADAAISTGDTLDDAESTPSADSLEEVGPSEVDAEEPEDANPEFAPDSQG